MVKPHSSVVIPISIPPSIPHLKDLMFMPRNITDPSRELIGVMPAHLMRTTTLVVQFDNICDYPIRVKKGQVMGTVTILKPRTKMTYFTSPSITSYRTPESMEWYPGSNENYFRTSAMQLQPSRLDILWHTLVEPMPVERAGHLANEPCIVSPRLDVRDVSSQNNQNTERKTHLDANSTSWILFEMLTSSNIAVDGKEQKYGTPWPWTQAYQYRSKDPIEGYVEQ